MKRSRDFEASPPLTRRQFLSRCGYGIGSLALGALLGRREAAASPAAAVRPLHHVPRAKRVILLYMAGGPSQLETLDPKPGLSRRDGEPMPPSLTRGQPIALLQGKPLVCKAPLFPFQRHGRAGIEVADVLPHTASVVDSLCVVRSMQTDWINHEPAHMFMNTGSSLPDRPSLGSWVFYALGCESDELPGFVVLMSQDRAGATDQASTRFWQSGFLPGHLQGTRLSTRQPAVEYLESPDGTTPERQSDVLAAIASLDRSRRGLDPVEASALESRIRQFELAGRMQASIPGVVGFSGEDREVLELYGAQPGAPTFASNCLLARRLAERGVRFIQIYHSAWDHHTGIENKMKLAAGEVDRASAALVKDLERRGMLEDTIVAWAGEFGRTPMAEGDGRDHHIRGFSLWLAGGGFKRGYVHGETDEFGYNVVRDPVHVHDLHATMLHALGLDHERVVYRHKGRDFRLTDVAGRVVHELLA